MKVDMSPEAVTARLKLTGQLWELSVKLRQPEVENSEAGLLDEGSLLEKSKTKSRRTKYS